MDRDPVGYVIVTTYNQASHQPGLNPGADLHSQLEDAVHERDWERENTKQNGRGETHYVARVFEMDEEEIGPELERERAGWARLVAKDKAARGA